MWLEIVVLYVIKMVETVVGLNYPTEEMQLEYLN